VTKQPQHGLFLFFFFSFLFLFLTRFVFYTKLEERRDAQVVCVSNGQACADRLILPPWWAETDQRKEKRKTIDDLIDFLRQHQKVPVKGEKDEDERKLGKLLEGIKSKKYHKDHPRLEELEGLLIELGGNFKGFESWWAEADQRREKLKKAKTVDDLIKWMQQHREKPSEKANDEHERKLGELLNHIKSQKNHKNHPRLGKLEELLIELDGNFKGFEEWWSEADQRKEKLKKAKTVDELIEWMQQLQTIPSQKAKDEDERKLGVLLSDIKSHGSHKNHPRLGKLEDLIRKFKKGHWWKDFTTFEGHWAEKTSKPKKSNKRVAEDEAGEVEEDDSSMQVDSQGVEEDSSSGSSSSSTPPPTKKRKIASNQE
jgi:hypothetical protein